MTLIWVSFILFLFFYADKMKHGLIDTWSHEITLAGGGNWEFQMYSNNRTNSFVEDGILHIRPTRKNLNDCNKRKLRKNIYSILI